jgi:hypothetical protein
MQAHSINADGTIIGTAVEGSGHIPVIFDGATSVPRDLRFTAGLTGTDYESIAINDNGQILLRECNHPSCSDAAGFLNARLVLLTPTYCSNSVRGDANGDGVVDSFDYDALAQATHPSASERQAYRAAHPDVNVLCALDINLDGKVDRNDMLALRIPGVTSGDANFDGQVDVLDIDSLARALTDPDAFRASVGYHGSLTMLGDVNGSGIFDLADVLYLYRLCPGYDVRYRINNLAGDANGDSRVDNFDIDPFVERLLWGEDAYRQSHPWVLQMCSMDLDRDGRITFFDVNIFADNLVRQL